MDTETYEQLGIPASLVGEGAGFLKENEMTYVLIALEKPIGVELPKFVELKVAQTDPGMRGDTATGAVKPATLETGAVVNVPLFINQGDVLKIDTRTGDYVERV
jgi:elongation factor P